MTLIEVVASLALLATLLGMAVVAQQRLRHQWVSARHRSEAIVALDRQLQDLIITRSLTSAEGIESEQDQVIGWPTDVEGELEGTSWRWRSSRLDGGELGSNELIPGISVIRFEAFDPSVQPSSPLATLDVLAFDSAREIETNAPPRSRVSVRADPFTKPRGAHP